MKITFLQIHESFGRAVAGESVINISQRDSASGGVAFVARDLRDVLRELGTPDLPDLHSPPGRDAVGLMDCDRVPLGAGYPVPVRQAPKPAAGLIQQKENKK